MERDFDRKEQERFTAILRSTISSLCKNGISRTVTRVEGLLGITLSNNVVFLVNVNEELCEFEGQKQLAEKQRKTFPGGNNEPVSITRGQEDILITHSNWLEGSGETPSTAACDGSLSQLSCSSSGSQSFQTRKRNLELPIKSELQLLPEFDIGISDFYSGIKGCEEEEFQEAVRNSCDDPQPPASFNIKKECDDDLTATPDEHSMSLDSHSAQQDSFTGIENDTSLHNNSRISSGAVSRPTRHSSTLTKHRHRTASAEQLRKRIKGGTIYKQYKTESIKSAIGGVLNGTLTFTQASRKFGIPRSTLRYMAKAGTWKKLT